MRLNKLRNYKVDYIKGVGMLLVIIGHMSICNDLYNWIYSFHMPLFTFISALYIKEYSKTELIKKAKRLLLPFVSFSLLSWFCYTLLTIIFYPEYLSEQLKKILYILAFTGQNACQIWNNGNVTLWFLPFLFCCILSYWIAVYFRLKFYDIIISILLAYLISLYDIKLPANLDTVFLLYPFFRLAVIYKVLNLNKFINILSLSNKILIFILLLILHLLLVSFNGRVDTSSNIFGNNIFVFYLTASIGISITILLFEIFNYRFRILGYIGQNSITYLILNIPLLQIFNCICDNNEPQYNILRLLFVVLFTIPLNHIITNYFPFMLGVKK